MDKPLCVGHAKAMRKKSPLIEKLFALLILLICRNVTPADVPSGIPQKAASAMANARSWRPDAILVSVDVNDYHAGNIIVRFSFYSPSNSSGLWITGDIKTPVNGEVNWSKNEIPVNFMDLPAAITEAHSMGMQGGMDHATLQFWNGELAW